jgi:hypothetical protein
LTETTHFHLVADLIEIPAAGPGLHVRLQQQDGLDEPNIILLHPWQVRAVCQQLGLAVGDEEASRTIAKLCRWLRLLHGRVTELAHHLAHFSDTAHADLSFEQQHAAATAHIADALLVDLTDLERLSQSDPAPPVIATSTASAS